jgi:hypothetical protein
VWGLEKSALLCTLTSGGPVKSLAVYLSPGSRRPRVAVGGDERVISLWAGERGDRVGFLHGHEHPVQDMVAFEAAPDVWRLVSGAFDMYVWDLNEHVKIKKVRGSWQ